MLFLQHDNATPHKGTEVNRFFEENEISVIPGPPKSPDLNLIESVWRELKNKLKRAYESKEDLRKDIRKCWYSMDPFFISKLYDGMKERISKVIASEGGPTDS